MKNYTCKWVAANGKVILHIGAESMAELMTLVATHIGLGDTKGAISYTIVMLPEDKVITVPCC